MTNREWLNSLTDEQLADFLLGSLEVEQDIKFCDKCETISFYTNIVSMYKGWTDSYNGLKKWLKEPQSIHLKGEQK